MPSIDNSIREAIDRQVDIVLKDGAIVGPPVCYKTLLEVERLQYNLFSEVDEYYSNFKKEIGPKEAKKLRGVLLVEDKHLFIKDEGYEKRVNFGFAHELAHWHLDWHQQLFYQCSEFDLSLKTRKQLEREANYFASRLAFMNGLFSRQVAANELSLSNIKGLSDTFQMSVESCLRTAVENEIRPCALLVMSWESKDSGYAFKVDYILYSLSFKEQVGTISRQQTFDANHRMTHIMNDVLSKLQGEYTYETKFGDTEKEITVEVWRHTYKAFALVKPK